MRISKLPKLQTIMLAAERHSRWGITVLSLVLALSIHLFFLFVFKIEPPPAGTYKAGSVLTWVKLPKASEESIIINKAYWNVEIKGPLSKYIKFPESIVSKSDDSENVNEFRLEIPENKLLPLPIRAVIFEIAIPKGEKVFSIIQSSGNPDFDSRAADYINSFPIKAIPSQEKKENTSSIVTINLEQVKSK